MLTYSYEVVCDKCGATERSGVFVQSGEMCRWYPPGAWTSLQGFYNSEWICPKHKVEIKDG